MLFNIPLMLKYIFTWQKSQRVGISLCLFLLRSPCGRHYRRWNKTNIRVSCFELLFGQMWTFPFHQNLKKKKDLIALLVVPFLNCCLMKSPRYRIALTPPGRLEHSRGPMSAHRTGLFQRTICQSCWGLHAVGSSRGSVLVKREEQRDGRYYSN